MGTEIGYDQVFREKVFAIVEPLKYKLERAEDDIIKLKDQVCVLEQKLSRLEQKLSRLGHKVIQGGL